MLSGYRPAPAWSWAALLIALLFQFSSRTDGTGDKSDGSNARLDSDDGGYMYVAVSAGYTINQKARVVYQGLITSGLRDLSSFPIQLAQLRTQRVQEYHNNLPIPLLSDLGVHVHDLDEHCQYSNLL